MTSNIKGDREALEMGWPSGDCPGPLEFPHQPEKQARNAILQTLSLVLPHVGSPQTTLFALVPPTGVVGRYRLLTPAGEWFVRVSGWLGNAALEQDLVNYLASEGGSVNRLLIAGLSLRWQEREFRIDVRDLLVGRHFDGSPDDLERLAAALRDCHELLSKYPQRERIRAAAKARYLQLSTVVKTVREKVRRQEFDIFGEHRGFAEEHREWFMDYGAHYQPRFDLLPAAQCLHGQVHPGNVLFTEHGDAVLVDWEEAITNYAPPAFDFAYLVQRFCMHDHPAIEILRQRLRAIEKCTGQLPPLSLMMRQIAWLSMAALIDYHNQGIAAPRAEYEKFMGLELQAKALSGKVC